MRDYSEEKTLYRSREGVILGVCRGIAEYLDFPVFWLRVIAVCALFFSWFFPAILLYLLAAILMKPEPVIPLGRMDDREFYSSYTSSRSLALYRLKKTFENLDRRIRRMEDIVTAKDYDWERRLKE